MTFLLCPRTQYTETVGIFRYLLFTSTSVTWHIPKTRLWKHCHWLLACVTVSARGGLNTIYSTDSDEDRSLRNPWKSNIEHWIQVISIGQNIRKSSILATFWTVNDLDRWLRERLGKERGSERERNKNWKTSRWIHSTYHKIALINQIFTQYKFFVGFIGRKYQRSAWHFWTFHGLIICLLNE